MIELSPIALATAFAAGIVSFLSPCVLPLVPGYVSYVAGGNLARRGDANATTRRLLALGSSLSFVAGFSTVFITLGAAATSIGQSLLRYRSEANIVGGVLVIVFGLFMMGALNLRWLHRDLRIQVSFDGGSPLAAYLMGLAFAFGWTPCIGPVLGTILAASAVTATVPTGIAMLAAYSLGLGLPFMATAAFTETLTGRLKALRRAGRWLQIGAGAGMVLMGVAMITGMLTRLGVWLLQTFPAFSAVG